MHVIQSLIVTGDVLITLSITNRVIAIRNLATKSTVYQLCCGPKYMQGTTDKLVIINMQHPVILSKLSLLRNTLHTYYEPLTICIVKESQFG